jgi:hypothetical protein
MSMVVGPTSRVGSIAASRRLILALALGASMPLMMGHTPYRQWQVYRRKHLLIGTHRVDPVSYRLGQKIAAALAGALPQSRARVTRGPDAVRLASLLTTNQLDVILLASDEVGALAEGRAPFDLIGATELRTLATTGGHHLIVRTDFSARHAWRIARSLPPILEPRATPGAPLHPGVVAFLDGAPMPPESPDELVPADHVH